MFFSIFVLVVILLLTLLKSIASKKHSFWQEKNIKCLKPVPIFGNMLPMILKTIPVAEIFLEMYRAFPNERYVGFYQFFKPILLIRDPELVKSLTIKNFEHFVDHAGADTTAINSLWGRNLFASKGERWRELRQTMTPVFTSSKMRSMFVLIDECAKQLVTYFKEFNQETIEVEIKDVFRKYTTDVIATAAFGIQCNSLKFPKNDFLQAGQKLADFSGLRQFVFLFYGSYPKIAKFFGLKLIPEREGNFFRGIINETIKLREDKGIIRPDLIHLLMLARKEKLKYEDWIIKSERPIKSLAENEDNMFLSNEDITAQAIIFFLGGFDTSSTAMSFLSYELAVNPEIQRRLREEVSSSYKECEGKVTYEKVSELKYLDMVFNETLRRWPIAYFLERQCTKSFTIEPVSDEESALTINKGDICWFAAMGIHMDPKYYENPEVFDPERFSDENKEKILNGTYLPFGIGPRNCIGSRFAILETKILLYNLLLEFEFVPTAKTQIPLKLKKNTVSLLPEAGFHIGLKRSKLI